MDKQKNVNNKCRTCLTKAKGLQSLQRMAIEGNSGEMSYAELLKEVADINVHTHRYDNFMLQHFSTIG